MLAAIPIAVFTNAARVTTTGVRTFYYGEQATGGALGCLVFLAALVLLILLNFSLQAAFRRISANKIPPAA
jgi:hypothetical protein